MTDNRERTNSTHEAYLRRVSIPPIMIPPPTPPQASQASQASQTPRVLPRVERRHSHPSEHNLPTGVKGCLCGCAKITTGYFMCPLVCPASCIAGACHSLYHALTCDKYNDGDDPHKLCVWFGCYNACVISSTWIEEGVADMRRKPQGEQDMVR